MRKDSKKITMTITGKYLAFLDDLVWNGAYLSKQSAIRAAIVLLMKEHGAFYIVEKIEEAENIDPYSISPLHKPHYM